MEGLEEICFEIISHSGQAKGLLMEAVTNSRAEHPDYSSIETMLKDTRDELKIAQKAHLKVLSDFAQSGQGDAVNPLYIHAEDQMMSAEIFLDLLSELITTNKELQEIKQQL